MFNITLSRLHWDHFFVNKSYHFFYIFTAECYEKLDVLSEDVVVSSDKNRDAGFIQYTLDSPELWCTELDDTENSITFVFNLVHNIYGFAIGGSTNTSTQIFVKKFKMFSKLFYWNSWSPVMVNGTEVCWLPLLQQIVITSEIYGASNFFTTKYMACIFNE